MFQLKFASFKFNSPKLKIQGSDSTNFWLCYPNLDHKHPLEFFRGESKLKAKGHSPWKRTLKHLKRYPNPKPVISTSHRRAEHPLAGQNSQKGGLGNSDCCVFWAVNGCFHGCLLTKIIFLVFKLNLSKLTVTLSKLGEDGFQDSKVFTIQCVKHLFAGWNTQQLPTFIEGIFILPNLGPRKNLK